MPKSRTRKRDKPWRTSAKAGNAPKPVRIGSGRWVAPTFTTLFLLGLIWVVVFYLSQGSAPIGALGAWNILVAVGFVGAGFAVSTRWK